MTSIRDRAREAQAEHHTDNHADDRAMEATNAIYDAVDALDTDKRSLLVTSALGMLRGTLSSIARAQDHTQVLGLTMVATSLLGVAAYANEVGREQAGFTSTGDRAVDDVLDLVRKMLHEASDSLLSPEQRELADRINAAVDARVEAGEDRESAVNAELREHAAEVDAVHAKDTTSESSTPSRYSGDGMYL